MQPAERTYLRHTWFPVARIQDVQTEGVVPATILGEDLVVYRVGDTYTVAGGHCPHRGMALWLGDVVDGGLQCPYHGWRFAPGSGDCALVPSWPEHQAPSRSGLRTYPSTTRYGHVWAALEEPGLPLPVIQDWTDPGWQFSSGEPRDLVCGLRQVTENFRDVTHFAFVHRGSMGPVVQQAVKPYQVHRNGADFRWTLDVDLGSTALDGNDGLAGRQTLHFYISLPMFATVRAEFPGGGQSLVVQFATPTDADGLRVRHYWLIGIDPEVPRVHGTDMTQMKQWEQDIFDEDFPIIENLKPVEAPLDPRSQAHTRADKFSLEYRRAYAELVQRYADEVVDRQHEAGSDPSHGQGGGALAGTERRDRDDQDDDSKASDELRIG